MKPMTITQYTHAFGVWGTVANLAADVAFVLGKSIAHLIVRFPGAEARDPDVYCAAFSEYLSERDEEPNGPHARLRLKIRKSCLLDRLIHCGEELRTVPCPEHKGKWSGCHFDPCPHGCSIGCGCTTGWLPSLDTAVKAYCAVASHNMERAREAVKLRYEVEALEGAMRNAATRLGMEHDPNDDCDLIEDVKQGIDEFEAIIERDAATIESLRAELAAVKAKRAKKGIKE